MSNAQNTPARTDKPPEKPAEKDKTPEERRSLIEEKIAALCRKAYGQLPEHKMYLATVHLADLRLVPRGLLADFMSLGDKTAKSFLLICPANLPKDAAETFAREWKALTDSGALRA